MADTSEVEEKVKTDEVEIKADTAAKPDAATPKLDDLVRIKKANKTLQKERDDFKAKWEQHEKTVAEAKLSAEEKAAKALREKDEEIARARAEAAAAKKERAFERAISKLVTKHNLDDPDYGELVLKGWDPDGEDDLDAWVAEAKKRPSIAKLFKQGKTASREVDEDGEDIVPKVAGSGSAKKAVSNWEEKEREIARQLYPHSKERQDNYIANVKKLKSEGAK